MNDTKQYASKTGGWQTMINFIIGAILSGTAGYVGMEVATSTNVKTMEAAKSGLNAALKVNHLLTRFSSKKKCF